MSLRTNYYVILCFIILRKVLHCYTTINVAPLYENQLWMNLITDQHYIQFNPNNRRH